MKKNNTNLVNIAKKYKLTSRFQGRTPITRGHINLAIMFMKGELTLSQCAYSLYGDSKKIGHGTYAILVRAMKEGFEKGIIKINK